MHLAFPLLLLGVLLNALAQLFLKAGMNKIGHFSFTLQNVIPIGFKVASNIPIIAGLSCYVISVLVWLLVLSRVEVSLAYPMVSLGYVVNAVAAYYLFAENLSFTRIIGISVILVGVFIVSKT
jgi:multidrug transporter EmrE-like cation transporter